MSSPVLRLNNRNSVLAAGACALAVVFAAPASASVLVLGNGAAADCSRAAFAGRSDLASIKTCNTALEVERLDRRDRAGTLVNRGVMQLRTKAYVAARRDFDAAIRLAPKLGEAYVNRGVSRMADAAYAEALDDVNLGLSLGVKEPAKAYYNRALVQESLGQARAAWLDYRKAQELAPEWEAPGRQLARFTVRTR